MDALTLGLILLWAGIAALVMVLVQRVRRGAWGAEAFEAAPPVAWWVYGITVLGLLAALAGAALTVWGLW